MSNARPALTLDELRQRTTLTVAEAAEALGISRPVAYELCRRGEIPTIGGSGGRRVLVPAGRLLTMLGHEPQANGSGHGEALAALADALSACAKALRRMAGPG